MNSIRNLETLDCKDTGCQKIDSVIYLRTSTMKAGEKRRWDAREEEAELEAHVFFFFQFYMLTWLAGNWYPIKIT